MWQQENLVVGMLVGVRSRPTSKSYLIQRYQWPVHQSIWEPVFLRAPTQQWWVPNGPELWWRGSRCLHRPTCMTCALYSPRGDTYKIGVFQYQGRQLISWIWSRIYVNSYVWLKYDLGQKYYAPQIRPSRGSNSWPPDHDSTFCVTEMPALATRPFVTTTHKGV